MPWMYIRSSFKKFPEFASKIYRNCCCEYRGVNFVALLMKLYKKKTPRKMENQELVFNAPQCSITPVSFSQGFLSTKQRNKIVASPILSWPASTWFLLVPWTETSIEGRHFCDVTDIIRNATEELKRLSQNGFQECFQHLYRRWQKCTVEWGVYFEGNLA